MSLPSPAWPHDLFADQVVVVTGSSRGIGFGIARAFLAVGARVVLTSRLPVALDSVLEPDESVRARHIEADLTDPTSIDALMDRAREDGPLAVLVNNAGTQPFGAIPQLSHADWRHALDLNLTAAAACIRAAADRMPDGGAIVNIASTVAVRPTQSAAYSASKAGLLALTASAAQTYGPRLRVNAISPGLVERPGLRDTWRDGVAAYEQAAPLGRIGTPADIADAVVFLASRFARWTTGANLVVDGGRSVVR